MCRGVANTRAGVDHEPGGRADKHLVAQLAGWLKSHS